MNDIRQIPIWKTPVVKVTETTPPLPAKRKARIKTASAKAKGRMLQQWVRDAILKAFSGLEQDDVRSTGMGQQGEDIQLSPVARRAFPFTVECKKRKADSVYTFYDQASQHGLKERVAGKPGYEPLVVVEADRRKPLAVVDFAFFMRMAQAYEAYVNMIGPV